ncbi:MAG: hypothetical protein IJC29_05655, partial [Clostridia bacterium]|nr:hypothetical protein [Clostridia bacterium]
LLGREDLIGMGEECLVRPENTRPAPKRTAPTPQKGGQARRGRQNSRTPASREWKKGGKGRR